MYSFNKSAVEIIDFIKKIKAGDYSLFLLDGTLRTQEQLFSILKFKSFETNELFKVIWQYAVKSEIYAPGSIMSFLSTLEGLLQDAIVNGTAFKKMALNQNWLYGTVSNKEEIEKYLDSTVLDKHLNAIIKTAIELAGLHGKIFIEKSQNEKTSIELSTGFNFEINTTLATKEILLDCAVVVIDGFVENVSELNKLFVELSEKKQRCLVAARGFSNDIISTVVANKNRSIFDCYLCVAPFELTSVNTLTDIAIVSGAQPISSNLGNLISNTSLLHAGFNNKIRILDNQIIITNLTTENSVKNHILDLMTRIKNSEEDELTKLLSKRLRSLQASTVTIRLADNVHFNRNAARLDKEFRTIKSIISYGLIAEKPAVWQIADKMAYSCIKSILDIGEII